MRQGTYEGTRPPMHTSEPKMSSESSAPSSKVSSDQNTAIQDHRPHFLMPVYSVPLVRLDRRVITHSNFVCHRVPVGMGNSTRSCHNVDAIASIEMLQPFI
jgi:hypothetical protein